MSSPSAPVRGARTWRKRVARCAPPELRELLVLQPRAPVYELAAARVRRRLDEIIAKADRGGLAALDADERKELPELLRTHHSLKCGTSTSIEDARELM